MKNRNIQFKPTAGVLIPLLLACFAAVFISAPTPAAARDLVPFKATFTGSSTSVPGAPCAALRSDIVGGGHATHLGNFTTVQHHCFDPADPTGAFTEGFYTFTGANGDTIFGTYHGNLVPFAFASIRNRRRIHDRGRDRSIRWRDRRRHCIGHP